MEIEVTLDAETCDFSGQQRQKVDLTLTHDPVYRNHVLLRFGSTYFTIPVDELYAALYYFREEAHR
jgi:hypothetical protein